MQVLFEWHYQPSRQDKANIERALAEDLTRELLNNATSTGFVVFGNAVHFAMQEITMNCTRSRAFSTRIELNSLELHSIALSRRTNARRFVIQ